ncbi:MAG: hypothetical protein DRP78_03735 [Candidatus Omnitrophota bacterium]|nr:MAG: hypothetical protein DRP78_03735 [Candidatus Omnitrophota bacterium]
MYRLRKNAKNNNRGLFYNFSPITQKLTNPYFYAKFCYMKKIIFISLFIITILCGCNESEDQISSLINGASKQSIINALGKPAKKVFAGKTKDNYPVEVWEYKYKKNILSLKKTQLLSMIFVDDELYSWVLNDPDFVLKELAELGALNLTPSDINSAQYLHMLRTTVENAQKTQKTLETIQLYQNFKNTQMQIQTQQQIRIIEQQKLINTPRPPPPPPPSPTQQKR